MTLADARTVLTSAQRRGRGIGAFNVIQLEHAEAYVRAAERTHLPVVLQISENTARYHGGIEPLGLACLSLARAADAPVVVHLDHAQDPGLVEQAVDLGFTSVMYDGAALPYEENVSRTREVVSGCHAAGVTVEAELGEIGGKDGAHAPGVRTDPGEAAEFVAATGADALAVAVGTSHAMADRSAVVDLDLVRALAATVPVPLVLHGSSGVDDEGLAACIAAGMTKVNVATRLNQVMTSTVRHLLAGDERLSDPRKYLGPARDAVTEETAELQQLLWGRES
ncbi:MAG: class II fructose-bisphosphate aldolase [Actinomycetota bacterium]